MIKKAIHPNWYIAKVICEDKIILEVGSTKKELKVDIWAGNHPFYTGSQKTLDTEGRVEKFERKYKLNKNHNYANNKSINK